jgi:hypothetical protein
MERPLQYTIKIYGEGFTEWHYFDALRTLNKFRFKLEPDMPQNSRSSYKQNLKLIDKELKKRPEERADALFLVIDTDTLKLHKKEFQTYTQTKKKYKKLGVTFIESHPCIEIWFLYHLMSKFARTNYETYEQLRPQMEALLPGYEKTSKYYRSNNNFKDLIIKDEDRRKQAMRFGMKACKYEPVDDVEVVNRSELFKAIMFFRLLQRFSEIRTLMNEALRRSCGIFHKIEEHTHLDIYIGDLKSPTLIAQLRYKDDQMMCSFVKGNTFLMDDVMPLTGDQPVIHEFVRLLENIE